MSRVIAFSLASLAFFAVPFTVRAQGELDDVRKRQEIATQKLTKQVADALSDSRRGDLADAKLLLQRTLARVQDSVDLPESKQASLSRQLRDRLTEVNNEIARARVADELRPYGAKPKPKSSGNYDETRPKGASSVAKDFRDGVKGAQDAHRAAIAQREVNASRIGLQIEKPSVIPGESGIAFPSKKEWERISERGKIKLTAKEAALLKSLNSVMSVNFKDDKFGGVIDYIAEKAQLTILVDEATKEDAKLDYDSLVNFKVPGKLTVRTILKKVLGDQGLTYVIKEGAIHVVTPKKASEMTVVRSYPISDLIQPNMILPPFYSQFQRNQNALQLIQLIQTTVEPSYWEPNGPGAISYYAPAQSLIIRGSAEMHYQLGGMSLLGR